VILTGSGRAFCASGDLDWITTFLEDPAARYESIREGRKSSRRCSDSLYRLSPPSTVRLLAGVQHCSLVQHRPHVRKPLSPLQPVEPVVPARTRYGP
jgi:hypothetical protein